MSAEHPLPTGPLAGIKVLDLGQAFMGPYCGLLLQRLGAALSRSGVALKFGRHVERIVGGQQFLMPDGERFDREYDMQGATLGYRYEGSPVIVPDGTPEPPDPVSTYAQTARPGHRAPGQLRGPRGARPGARPATPRPRRAAADPRPRQFQRVKMTDTRSREIIARFQPLLALAIMIVGIFLPMGPLADYFKLQPLPLSYFGWLAATLLAYCTLTTLTKRFYIRRFGWPAFYGDATRLDLLRVAGAGKASVFVLAIDDVEQSVQCARLVREHFPALPVVALPKVE